jgi:hypothetical protein
MNMSKKVAILQSNYIPWKGYFDVINSVDEFVFYDTEQYTKRDWRNRNKIKTPNGLIWLTIPVEVSGKFFQAINETKVANNKWRQKHWKSILSNYSKAPYFKTYKEDFYNLFIETDDTLLSEINFKFIKKINFILGINTKLSWSSDYFPSGEKSEKLLDICKKTEASEYISGPAAKVYLNEELFHSNNIKVKWMNYSNYPIYNQLSPPFEHGVSIIDLIFNEGPNAARYLKSFNTTK